MFTGIVQVSTPITSLVREEGLVRLSLNLPKELLEGLELGASVSLDGVCLTAARIGGTTVGFDLMQETLDRSTFSTVEQGDPVNVERSLRFGQEIGGHLVSGHVDCTARIVSIERPVNNYILTFEVPRDKARYILPKGYISINGASLTVVDVDAAAGRFTVHLIPETLRITTFGSKKPGDFVNIEVDRQTQAIVDTVERYLSREGRIAGSRMLEGASPSSIETIAIGAAAATFESSSSSPATAIEFVLVSESDG